MSGEIVFDIFAAEEIMILPPAVINYSAYQKLEPRISSDSKSKKKLKVIAGNGQNMSRACRLSDRLRYTVAIG